MEKLKKILTATDAAIVLSTFWRNFTDYIVYIFSRYGINSIIGTTPGAKVGSSAADETNYSNRSEEIRSWLGNAYRHSISVISYVIIDDRNSAATGDEQLARFVKIDSSLGLTDCDVEKAIEILKN